MRIPLNFINIDMIQAYHLCDMILITPLGQTLGQKEHTVCVVGLLSWEAV